jgi:hypothetical protein
MSPKFMSHAPHYSQKLPKWLLTCILCCLLPSPKGYVGRQVRALCPLSPRKEQSSSTWALLTFSKDQSHHYDVLATLSYLMTAKIILNVCGVIFFTKLVVFDPCALLLPVSKNDVQELRCVLLALFSNILVPALYVLSSPFPQK